MNCTTILKNIIAKTVCLKSKFSLYKILKDNNGTV